MTFVEGFILDSLGAIIHGLIQRLSNTRSKSESELRLVANQEWIDACHERVLDDAKTIVRQAELIDCAKELLGLSEDEILKICDVDPTQNRGSDHVS